MNLRKMYHWVKEMTSEWEGFTRHFKANVEVFSRAVARARSSHIRAIAGYAGGNADSQRRRLQRFVKHPHVLTEFFRQWSQAIVKLTGQAKVTLIVDETKIEDRFGIMVVALAIEERAIPLAWEVYRANDKAAYPGEGQVNLIVKLLKAIQGGVPASVQVRVLADRGIGTSPALMRAIHAMGWPPADWSSRNVAASRRMSVWSGSRLLGQRVDSARGGLWLAVVVGLLVRKCRPDRPQALQRQTPLEPLSGGLAGLPDLLLCPRLIYCRPLS